MQLCGIHHALSLCHAIGTCLENYYNTKQVIDARNISVYISVCVCIYRCIHTDVISIYTYCGVLLLQHNPPKSKILFPDDVLLAFISFILLMIDTFFYDVLFGT